MWFLKTALANRSFQKVHNQRDILRMWLAPLRLERRSQPRIEFDLVGSTVAEPAKEDRQSEDDGEAPGS